MLSRRFAVAIAAMLALSGAGAAFFEFRPHRVDPCRDPGVLAITSLIPTSKHVRVRKELPDATILWAEGEFENPLSEANPFRYQIVRSYDTLRVSTHPLNFVANDIDAESQRINQIEVGGRSLPVHVVEDFTRVPPRVIAYLQIYGETPTASPIGTHLDQLFDVLARGARPVTTIIVDGPITRAGLERGEEAIGEWIGGAWTFFDRFCSHPADGT